MSINAGTIFRVFLNTTTATTTFQINVDTEDTSGRCGVCVENMVLIPEVATADQQNFWSLRSYVQFSSPSLPPFIDVTSDATADPPQKFDLVFDRVPLNCNGKCWQFSTYQQDQPMPLTDSTMKIVQVLVK